MNNNFSIAEDGTIFSISEDGTINRVANVNNLNSTINDDVAIEKLRRKNAWKVFFIVILLASILGLGFYSYCLLNDLHYCHSYNTDLSSENSNLMSENSSLLSDKTKLNNRLEEISEVYPLIIKDIQIANVYDDGRIETYYGGSLYENNTMYFKPRITYVGLKSYKFITLKIKLYTPSGTLSTGTSSPNGASYSYSFSVLSGENTQELTGWGNSSKGNWSDGTYRIEVWYNDLCLRTKTFYVY